jgi:cytoskeletal protein RodZ
VFLLNYVRSYATIVGLDPDDALNRLEQVPGAPRAAEFDPAALEVVRRQRAISMLWVCIAVAALGVAAVAADTLYDVAVRASYR